MFHGLTGDLIKAELRSGNDYTSRQVVRFIGPVLKRYLKNIHGLQDASVQIVDLLFQDYMKLRSNLIRYML